MNGLLLGSIYGLIALGYTMVYGILKLINFAHGEVFMLGAYSALITTYLLGYTPGVAFASPKPVMAAGTLTTIGIVLMVLAVLALILALRVPKTPTVVKAFGGLFGVLGVLGFLVGKFQPQAENLLIMLIAAMTICSLVGVLIGETCLQADAQPLAHRLADYSHRRIAFHPVRRRVVSTKQPSAQHHRERKPLP